uniref:Uncharacterized protein n=1 Tax=Solanum tuberosum TaxID=4113 RepID=M1DP80_SOLTU
MVSFIATVPTNCRLRIYNILGLLLHGYTISAGICNILGLLLRGFTVSVATVKSFHMTMFFKFKEYIEQTSHLVDHRKRF